MARQARDHVRKFDPLGLVVAGVGFFLTRFTVALAVSGDPMRFLLIGIVPLVLGLSVAAFGVALAVGSFERVYVRTVALWCLAGTASMGALVFLTLYGTDPSILTDLMAVRSRTYLSNFLIGGCVGGTLTGVYAARNQRERVEQREQAKRMAVLNRVFRDRVLNAITAVRGHVGVLRTEAAGTDRERAVDVIEAQSESLAETVSEVKHLTAGSPSTEQLERVDLCACVRSTVETAQRQYPDAEVVVRACPDGVSVWANELLEHALDRLVENAIVHNDASTPRVEITVRDAGASVTVSVADNGPGLPTAQQAMLDGGTVEEYDDPSSGFGLNLVTLLVESFRGTVSPTVSGDGTTIDVSLPVAESGSEPSPVPSAGSNGVSTSRLALVGAVALVAGAVMGALGEVLAGVVPVIGSLYGAPDPVVGFLTHEFHSVVFGVVYVALLAVTPAWYRDTLGGRVSLAVVWALLLWLVAAGMVMPLWLQLVGIPATVPNLSLTALLTHLVWGVTLGGLYSPSLDALSARGLVQ